ncbi:MAG: CHAT domain-containing protein [Verrucomicrobiota bacterium]
MAISPYKTLKEKEWPFPKPAEPTLPELFIIESMNDMDEDSGFFEGVRIAQILRLARLKPKYFYIQDERELELLVPVFRQSNYRYLHISCHGDDKGFFLTNGYVSFARFAEIFAGALLLRRIFVSACEAGQKDLVHELHASNRGIQSLIAPQVKIDYDHAAAIWSSFYTSLLGESRGKVTHSDIRKRMALLVRLFPWANKSLNERMSFMFAGYNPTNDAGDTVRPEAWNFEEIHYRTML